MDTKKRVRTKFKCVKSNFKFKKLFYEYAFLLNLILFSSLFGKYFSEITYKYLKAITLLNGNIFMINENGIDIYDPSLSTKITGVLAFDKDEKIIYDDLSLITFTSFTESDNGYIICIINNKIYIFDKEGTSKYISQEILEELQGEYYTLIPIKKENNIYYYMIGFINQDKCIQLLFFNYNDDNKTNTFIKVEPIFDSTRTIQNKGLSCQLMEHPSNRKMIVCFVNFEGSHGQNIFSFFLIEPETHEVIINEGKENASFNLASKDNKVKGIKSAVTLDSKKALVCFYLQSSDGFCTIYSIIDNSFSEYVKYSDLCRDDYHAMTVSYVREKEEFIFSCSNNLGTIKYSLFNKDFEFINSFSILNSGCSTINSYSILYSQNKNRYFLISDSNCPSKNIYLREIEESSCPIKCSRCNKDISEKLCLECNTHNNYYQINPKFLEQNSEYFDCYNESTKLQNFFFNKTTKFYEPCYMNCATCEYGGDGNENNCTTCGVDYMKEPEIEGSKNCVPLCRNYYYYTSYKQFKCSSSPQCPEENSLLIRDKKKCIESCLKDEEYSFQYNGECLKKCPEGTSKDPISHICKLINNESCSKSSSEFELYNFLKEGGVEKIAKTYSLEFNYTDKHISIFKNQVYSIMLYKDKDCISELELTLPEIDFGACYTKVQDSIKINTPLIVAIVEKYSDKKSNPITSYSFYNPINGTKLDSETLCKEEVIVVKENLKSLLNDSVPNMDSILFLTDQNIDVFNKSGEFYTDLCYHFESPNNKDVALRDRLLVYYPNITLCDSGCDIYGVNLTSMTAICTCKYKEMTEDNTEQEEKNIYQNAVNEVFDILDQINLAVMACYKDLFQYKYFVKCTGGIIILCLIVIQCISIIIYFFLSFFTMKKYIFNLTENYILLLNKSPMFNIIMENKINQKNAKHEKKSESGPPKKVLTSSGKDLKLKIQKLKKKNDLTKRGEEKPTILKTQESPQNRNHTNLVLNEGHKSPKRKKVIKANSNNSFNLDKSIISMKSNDKSNTNSYIVQAKINTKYSSFYDQYLKTQIDEMRFYDAMKNDKRLFFDYFCDEFKKKEVFLELILIKEPLKPRTLKILMLILDIEVCFVVNAMFINEDYISKLFHSDKEENFISFLPRAIDRSIFTIIACFIISYFVECLFIEERRIKNILKYKKNNIQEMKYEISLIMKELKWRYNIFIILTLVISFFSWFYISCFNNIYPHTKLEWIKSSILIIIFIYIFFIIITLIETLLRFISFEIKSERMYRASLWLS